jgi:2-oxoisovalerate dehydrogenase E1 component alpha subunit
MKNWLIARRWWDEKTDKALQETYRSEILTEMKLAEKRDKQPLSSLVTDVYKTTPAHLLEQFQHLQAHIGKYPDRYTGHAGC